MFKQLNFFFILILPLVFKYIFLFFFIDLELFDLEDILEDIFFFFAIILLFQSKIFKKQFFADALYVIYIFYFILETTSYIAVLSNFSSSYMYLLIESNNAELYNLKEDPGELNDLSLLFEERKQILLKKLNNLKNETNANKVSINPNFKN